ncbi:MAG: hypothetical protein RLZZ141_926 [Pseudomonadota bacterium]
MDQKKPRFENYYWIAAFLGVLAIQYCASLATRVVEIPYSRFEQLLNAGQITEVTVSPQFVQGRLKAPIDGKRDFISARVEPQMAAQLQPTGVQYSGRIETSLVRDVLSWILPLLLFFALWAYWIRRAGVGGLMQVGRSHAKIYVQSNTGVTFEDIAGVDEAKEELKEIIDFLKDPKAYGRLGGRMPKGILLLGPPGTGKTLLAKAVAGEAKVPFFSISGSEFVEMFVGVGAARVRDLFKRARDLAPAIIFIDELDALGRTRGPYAFGGQDEKEQTLNQLLVEMDGFDTSVGVVLLAATNRPEIIDPALLRAGRFDRQVLLDRPDKKGRLDILKVHTRRVIMDPDIDLEAIAALTPGFTGADLANLVNEAALLATRSHAAAIGMAHVNEAIERIVAGLAKHSRLLNLKDRQIVAYHEMGHAIIGLSLPGVERVHKVSIIPRGMGALGYTIQRPTEDRFIMTKEELENKICVLLGGRASEWLVYQQLSTGAADDLIKVTDIAHSMVTQFGMSKSLGPVSYDHEPRKIYSANGMAQPVLLDREKGRAALDTIDAEVRSIIEAAFDRTLEILKAKRAALDQGAQLLLQKETLEADELKALMVSNLEQPR